MNVIVSVFLQSLIIISLVSYSKFSSDNKIFPSFPQLASVTSLAPTPFLYHSCAFINFFHFRKLTGRSFMRKGGREQLEGFALGSVQSSNLRTWFRCQLHLWLRMSGSKEMCTVTDMSVRIWTHADFDAYICVNPYSLRIRLCMLIFVCILKAPFDPDIRASDSLAMVCISYSAYVLCWYLIYQGLFSWNIFD